MAEEEAPQVDPQPAALDSISAAAPAASDSPEPTFDALEASADPGGSGSQILDAAAIEELLKGASFEDPASLAAAASSLADGAASLSGLDGDEFRLPNFQQVMQDAQVSSIDLLRDVELNVKIELGRARMLVEDVLKLSEGSVVELDKLAGDPVDVFVNDRLVARGEVLVLNDNFCVRVNEIVAGVKEEG